MSISDENEVTIELPEFSAAPSSLGAAVAGNGISCSSSGHKIPLGKTDSGFHTMSFKNHNFQTLEQETQCQQQACSSANQATAIVDPPDNRQDGAGMASQCSGTRLSGPVRRQSQADGNQEERKCLMEDFDTFSTVRRVRPRTDSDVGNVVSVLFRNDDNDDVTSSRSGESIRSCDIRSHAKRTRPRDYRPSKGRARRNGSQKTRISPLHEVNNDNDDDDDDGDDIDDDDDDEIVVASSGATTRRPVLRKSDLKSRSWSNLSLKTPDENVGQCRRSPDLSEQDRRKRTRILQRELSRLKQELTDLGDLEMEVTFV